MIFWIMGAVSIGIGCWLLYAFGDVQGWIRCADKRTRLRNDDWQGISCSVFLIFFGAFLWSLT